MSISKFDKWENW